jgi:hypothetical protein
MEEIQITVEPEPNPKDRSFVIQGMIKFNESIVGPENSRPLFIAVRYENAEMAGGLIGFTHWNWVVHHLFLAG